MDDDKQLAPDDGFSFLVGCAGSVAHSIRAYDWSTSPIGPQSRWSPAMKLVIRNILGSGLPMCIGLGPDLILLYNDAWRRQILGRKHRDALGRKLHDAWPMESELTGSIIDSVHSTGRPATAEWIPVTADRDGFEEQRFHNLSCSLLTDEAGEPFGVMCIASEALTAHAHMVDRHEALREIDPSLVTADVDSSTKVLIVGGNADMRRRLETILSHHWSLDFAHDGTSAIEMMKGQRPDLILSDEMTPCTGGLDLLRRIRTDPELGSVPFILLSTTVPEAGSDDGTEIAPDDYLIKPFSSLDLIASIRGAVQLDRIRSAEETNRQALIDALDDAVVIAGTDGVVRYVNRAFEKMLGYSRDELPYHPPLPWIPPPEGEKEVSEERAIAQMFEFAEAARADPSGRLTLSLTHADGRLRFVNVSISALAGDPNGNAIALMRDVTADIVAASRESALGNLALELADEADLDRLAQLGLEQILDFFDGDLGGLRYNDISLDREVVSESDRQRLSDGLADIESHRRLRFDAERPDRPGKGPVLAVGAPLFGDQGAIWVGWDDSREFGTEDRSLFTALCAQLGQALQRAGLDIERKQFATSIQQSILSSTPVPDHVAVRYVPALQPLEVGGDWYDVVDLGFGRTGLVVGDCVGRGVDAASTMIKLRSATRALLLRSPEPVEVLNGLDDFGRTVNRAFCATAMVGVVEPDGLWTWASAAHVPGLLIRGDGTTEVLDQAQSAPLGAAHGRTQHSVQLGRGDRLIYCSDGLIERRGEILDEGLDRLTENSLILAGEPVQRVADELLRTLGDGSDFSDDVALVVFEYRAVAPVRLVVPAELSMVKKSRSDVREWLGSLDASDEVVEDLLLAVSEALANAIEHSTAQQSAGEDSTSYGSDGERVAIDHPETAPRAVSVGDPTSVEVLLFTDGSTVTSRVTDRGRWREADESGRSLNRGRGLKIIRAVTDSCEISTGTSGTVVKMTRKLGPHGSSLAPVAVAAEAGA